MQIHWGVATDAGGHRQVNEDSVLAHPPMFVVADGMGGHARGDMASRAVIGELEHVAHLERPVRPEDVIEALHAAARRIRETMAGQDEVAGSTAVGAVLTEQDGEPFWLVFNVGDSRAYRWSAQGMEQISVDHSLVQEMVESGAISPAEAREHPHRNVITRAVGTGRVPEVDFWMLRAGGPEQLVLCSDGLLGELSDEEVARVLAEAGHPQEAAATLVRQALHDGGAADNVTVVVVSTTNGSATESDDLDQSESTLPRVESGAG